MITIRMDGQWRLEDLAAFVEPIELYDAQGKFIGLFVPANMERGKEIYAKAAAMHDPVETERRLREQKPGRLHSELLDELRAKYPVNETSHEANDGASSEAQQCGTR
jgi:hypothetical protein